MPLTFIAPVEFPFTTLIDSLSKFNILLDSDTQSFGGSGKTFNWEVLEELTPKFNGKWVLSGGLNVGNIVQVMTRFNPPFVDVSSGVEVKVVGQKRPGIKDHNEIEDFLKMVASFN